MVKRAVIILVLTIAVLILTGPMAHAEAPQRLINVTPASTTISVDPGGSEKGTMLVTNLGTTSFSVTIYSNPYYVKGLDYSPTFTQLPGKVDASKWVHFASPTAGTISPQQQLAADYTVDPPAGTAPGGYYVVIFAETDTSHTTGGSTSGITAHNRVGDILYITVNGDVKSAGTAIALDLPKVIVSTPVNIAVVVSNLGGIHFQTTVETTIKDMFGRPDFTDSKTAYILPQTQRQISTSWSPQTLIGIYQISQTATLPGDAQQLTTQWVIITKPWVIITLIAIIIVIVISALLRIKQASRKRSQ